MSGENWNTQTLAILSNHSYAKPEILKTFISWPPRFCTNSQNCPQVVRTWNKKYLHSSLLSTLLSSLDFSKSKTSFPYTRLFHKFFFVKLNISADYLYPSLTSILPQSFSFFNDLNISSYLYLSPMTWRHPKIYSTLPTTLSKIKYVCLRMCVCLCLCVHYHSHGNQIKNKNSSRFYLDCDVTNVSISGSLCEHHSGFIFSLNLHFVHNITWGCNIISFHN